jgi:4-hydroxyphenylpyruvate dioxygenase
MKIDHVRFYVTNAVAARDWFVKKLEFRSIASGKSTQSQIEIVQAGSIYFVLCSTQSQDGAIARYLQKHPSGVSDLAFCVPDLKDAIARAVRHGATVLRPIQTEQGSAGCLRWATINAWGDLTHTLLQRSGITPLLPHALLCNQFNCSIQSPCINRRIDGDRSVVHTSLRSDAVDRFIGIDHVVLNVPSGDLGRAVDWYETVLGLQPQQRFDIQTDRSALSSQVMLHPLGLVQLPINEPASANSQIQEFLDLNRGAGIQHIALETENLVETIARLRQNGLALIRVPETYYSQLRERPGLPISEAILQAIAAQEILIDWQDDSHSAALLQIFTEPIFDQPTVFLELIERQTSLVNGQLRRAYGFGEGNFRALFEAIERQQIQRGSLDE